MRPENEKTAQMSGFLVTLEVSQEETELLGLDSNQQPFD